MWKLLSKSFWSGMFWPQPILGGVPPVVDVIGFHQVTVAQTQHRVTAGGQHTVTLARTRHFVTVPDED